MGWMDVINRLKDAVGLTDRQVAALERRRVLRVQKKVGVVGIRCTSENVQMVAHDFGPRGLRLETATRLQKDEPLMIYSAHQHKQSFRNVEYGDDPTAPVGIVVWVKPSKDGLSNQIGLSFKMETEAERENVARFLLNDCEVGLTSSGKEHRLAPRVQSTLDARLETPNGEMSGTVRDIAVGGALITVDQAMNRHSIVKTHIRLPDSAQPLVCRGVVVRCLQKENDQYELGIAFTTVPPDHKERLVSVLSRKMREATSS